MWIYDHFVFHWTAEFFMAGAAFGCLYTLVACVVAMRIGRDNQKHGSARSYQPVPVSILMPLCGHEPGLENRLRTLCAQNYAAPVQVICGVLDAADPAVAVARKVAAELPGGAIALNVDPRLHGCNLKMSNLINMLDGAHHDVFVMIDSDIDVGPDYLGQVVEELQKPGVGAVTSLYYGIAKGGLWAQLSAMSIDLQFLPSAMVGLFFGLARPCFGATIAITRDTLREIGGLSRFADQLWDDYAIGEAVRASGRRVAIPSSVVGHVCTDSSARELFSRQFRYARTIGSIEPLGHVGAVVMHPLALALCALFAGGGEAAVALAATALITRAALCWCIEQRFGAGANSYWLLPIRDLAAFAVYVMSLFGGTVVWRGQRYRVRSDGTLFQTSQ